MSRDEALDVLVVHNMSLSQLQREQQQLADSADVVMAEIRALEELLDLRNTRVGEILTQHLHSTSLGEYVRSTNEDPVEFLGKHIEEDMEADQISSEKLLRSVLDQRSQVSAIVSLASALFQQVCRGKMKTSESPSLLTPHLQERATRTAARTAELERLTRLRGRLAERREALDNHKRLMVRALQQGGKISQGNEHVAEALDSVIADMDAALHADAEDERILQGLRKPSLEKGFVFPSSLLLA